MPAVKAEFTVLGLEEFMEQTATMHWDLASAAHEFSSMVVYACRNEAPVDTGELRDAIIPYVDEKWGDAGAICNLWRAHFIEYGHLSRDGGSFVAANDFMTRGFNKAQAALPGLYARDVQGNINDQIVADLRVVWK